MRRCRIRLGHLLLILTLLALGHALPARADIDPEELMAHTALKDRRSQKKVLQQIEADRAAELRREAEQALEAQRAEEERLRAEAARPWPVRLTEQRCTLCHPAVNLTRSAHALPGWWAVALRMKYVNKAPVNWDELQVIVPHLSELHPARGADYLIEWLLLLGLLFSPLLLLGVGYLARQIIRGHPP